MLIAQRKLRVGKGHLAEGDIIFDMAGRNWGKLLSTAAVVRLSPAAISSVIAAAMPFDEELHDEAGVLLGSSIQPALINMGSGRWDLDDLVSCAFKNSGLSLMAWNALTATARETLIWAEFQFDGTGIPVLEAAEDRGGAAAGPGDPPEGPHILFDPSKHSLKYRGAVVGYWIMEDGENIIQIDKAQYQRLKGCAAEGMSAYVKLTEGQGEDSAGVAGPGGDQAAAA